MKAVCLLDTHLCIAMIRKDLIVLYDPMDAIIITQG